MPNDLLLQHAVQAALECTHGVVAAHVGVTARDGLVTLTGTAPDLQTKLAAEGAALAVLGVRALAEEIEVQMPDSTHRSDETIARAALWRIAADASILPGTVQVEVEDGWVTLTGMVDWPYQKRAAGQDMQGLPGASGVSNELTVEPARTEADVQSEIMQAVRRSGIRNPGGVGVAVTGGLVRLSGAVQCLQDRDTMSTIAWATPGVVGIENDIEIR